MNHPDYIDAIRYAVDYEAHCLGKWNIKEENKMEGYELRKHQLKRLFCGADPLNYIEDATVESNSEETLCIVRLKVPHLLPTVFNHRYYPVEPIPVVLRQLMDEHMNSAIMSQYTIMSTEAVRAGMQKTPEKEPPKPIRPEDKKPAPVEPMMPERIVYSGPKTIVFWPDGTKTILSRMDGQEHDEYYAFCAAVVKKMFGSTPKAKKFLDSIKFVQ